MATLFLITLLSLSLPIDVSSINPVSTSGAATIQYWNRKIPNKAPHPDFFLALFAPLPASLFTSPLTISPSLCRSARLLCPNSTYIQPMSSTKPTPAPCLFYRIDACRICERNKFFRERELKEGNVMLLTDISNKFMPLRSFLPRSIADKIPFEAEAIKSMFGLEPNTTLAKAVDGTLADCQSLPIKRETKRCITSAENMIDFAVDILGNDIVVRSTESLKGFGGSAMIGQVNGLNGGNVTRSVSCHQSLFPYMVYHCHTGSKIRVYEAEIMSVESKERINQGIAICHLDTSSWNAGHGAFAALGGKPGQIEVCHWIFNGDMTWVVTDHS